MSGFIRRKYLALVILIVTGLIFGGLMSGCGLFSDETLDTLLSVPEAVIDEQEVPLANVDLTFITSLFEVPMPDAPGLLVESNAQAFIDYSNKHDGYVTVGFLENTDNILRVLMIVPGGREYIFNLRPGENEVLPLANGNGQYIISVHEHVVGNTFLDIISVTIDVELINELAPFIRPNQLIWYDNESPTTKQANELRLESHNQNDLIRAIYNFVVENIIYDFELAEAVELDYTADIYSVLERGSGICLDIATLTAAMLRSQGIPAKLVFGYLYDQDHGNIYHAWVSVYAEEDGMFGDNIYISGGTWILLDPTTDTILIANETGVTAGDGKIYHDLYYY